MFLHQSQQNSWQFQYKLCMKRYYISVMKHLLIALKKESPEKEKSELGTTKSKSKGRLEKWSLDPDIIEHKDQENKIKFMQMTQDLLTKKFENEKYIEEENFQQILIELNDVLSDLPNQLQRLSRIQQTLNELGQSFTGEMKNNLKHLQSLLDAKIRKLKRREKKTQLTEFDRIADIQKPMRRKQKALFINEDDRQLKIKMKEKEKNKSRLQSRSKKSFGTIGSIASNENESGGSGKNYSGSQSRSGEANALAVLLANVQPKEDKKNQKGKDHQKQQYDFSSVLCASITVRQRSPVHKLNTTLMSQIEKPRQREVEKMVEEDKDQAFIFHRPKTVRRGKF